MKNLRNRRGITLIALVVTIVVLIILATISINAVIGQGGIIEQAKRAKGAYEGAQTEELTKMQGLANELAQYYTDGGVKNEESGGGEDNPTESITVTLDGKTETITKDNVADYLGKVVTNYKPTASTVTVGGTEYTVSTQYRLYYVDFDKKYGNEVSVFLKADCTNNNYELPVTDETSADASNVKIKALNPALYKTGVTSPTASNYNMKAVTFLTNTSNWNSLKTGSSLASKVNYVVGAPSLEMMMDSYNTKYGLTGETPDTSVLSESTDRVKLFYKYPYNSNNYGYGVGPCNYGSIVKEYGENTSKYSVKPDSAIDSMYYPGDNQWYWLASPATTDTVTVMYVEYHNGGYVVSHGFSSDSALCPLVSLQSSVTLELQ